MKKQAKTTDIPSMQEIETERKRIRRGIYTRSALYGTIRVLIFVAAVSVLVVTLFLPILQISGDSMSPTLENNEIVVLIKNGNMDRGDLIGFYYQGKILIKRIIALPDETIVIDGDGGVTINGVPLEEPYVTETCLGDCDIEFPYTVPGGSYFVMGDRRTSSVDSRNSTIGSIKQEDIIGKLILRVWPLPRIGYPG